LTYQCHWQKNKSALQVYPHTVASGNIRDTIVAVILGIRLSFNHRDASKQQFMTPDVAGLIAIVCYLGLAAALVILPIRRWGVNVWIVTLGTRLYTTLMFQQKVHRVCPLPKEGGALVVGNHRSPVDPLVIYSGSLQKTAGFYIREIEFLTAKEYCNLGGPIGWFVRTARCIPVDRESADLAAAKDALRRLRGSRIVGIFPEGRLNTEAGDGVLPFQSGVGWLALRGNAPVYPIYVRNAPRATSMVGAFLRRQRVDVYYGDSIDLSRWKDLRPTEDVLLEVTEHIQQEVLKLRNNQMADQPPYAP